MTITYEYEDALYVNLTNKCNCNCEFCLRHGRKEGSIYTEDSLWLEREPTREEALDSFLSRDVPTYREIVFCGYGEPTYRLDDILWLVDQLKERFGRRLPPVRINTNGHANLILGRDVVPELKGRIDTLSISLNAVTAAEYTAPCAILLRERRPIRPCWISPVRPSTMCPTWSLPLWTRTRARRRSRPAGRSPLSWG